MPELPRQPRSRRKAKDDAIASERADIVVKSIADSTIGDADAASKPPGFVKYIVYYTLPILIPIYVLVWAVFFAGG